MQNDIKRPTDLTGNQDACMVCGQKFGFWQRFMVSHQGTITCKNCKTNYTVLMRINSGKVGGLGGGLGGASIILGFLIGDRYFRQPFWGLIIGVLIALCITIYIYRYTWRNVKLHPKS